MTERTWMTVKQVRAELQYDSDDAARKWLRRMQVVGVSRVPGGRKKIYARADVERALTDSRRRQQISKVQDAPAETPAFS